MRYILILLVFASCQPVSRYNSKEATEDTASVKQGQEGAKECVDRTFKTVKPQ